MKKISKSLIAVATAFAVSTAGVTVATAAENEVNTTVDASQNETTNEDENSGNETTTPAPAEESGSSEMSSDMDPDDIRDWIGVFTAVIGALSALFTFIDRNF